MLNPELLAELKQIIEEEYGIVLTDFAVERIGTFLVAYISILKKTDMEDK